jgi:hypothetical protein
MQIQKIIITAGIALGLILVVFPSYQYYKANKLYVELQEKFVTQVSNYNTFMGVVTETTSLRVLSNDKSLNSEYLYEHNHQKIDSIAIRDVVNHMFLFIPENSCSSCYDDMYNFIQYAKDTLEMKILPVTVRNRYREIKRILTEHTTSNLYYVTSDSFLKGGDDIQYMPYFVFVDQEQIGRNLFVPLINHAYVTKAYLTRMKQRYKDLFRK